MHRVQIYTSSLFTGCLRRIELYLKIMISTVKPFIWGVIRGYMSYKVEASLSVWYPCVSNLTSIGRQLCMTTFYTLGIFYSPIVAVMKGEN